MFDEIELGREFFEALTAIDEAILKKATAEACPFCQGPLYRGDYPRKPRGGLLGVAAEGFDRRFSLCCGREGCRRRATPPSVRFLGRRVYIGAVVIVASVMAIAMTMASVARSKTGIAPRTLRRWSRWWRGSFVKSDVFRELSGRIAKAARRRALPASILSKMSGDPCARVAMLLRWLAPLTTRSTPNGSRLVRELV